MLQDDMRLRMLIDADPNAATGLLDGTDYCLLYDLSSRATATSGS